MDNVVVQIREFKGKWSVMARIWSPQKAFYEHPAFIDLSKEEAQEKCDECISQNLTVDEIVKDWEYIGN